VEALLEAKCEPCPVAFPVAPVVSAVGCPAPAPYMASSSLECPGELVVVRRAKKTIAGRGAQDVPDLLHVSKSASLLGAEYCKIKFQAEDGMG
jgi:hypothetical protein